VSLICRTLDVINRLFSCVLSYTQSIAPYIHSPVCILFPSFPPLQTLGIHLSSPSPRSEGPPTNPYLHMYMRIYEHVNTPTTGKPVPQVPWVGAKRSCAWQTHTRGFHLCCVLVVPPDHVRSVPHTYMYTHSAHMYIHEYWLGVLTREVEELQTYSLSVFLVVSCIFPIEVPAANEICV